MTLKGHSVTKGHVVRYVTHDVQSVFHDCLLSRLQKAYRINHSTETAVLRCCLIRTCAARFCQRPSTRETTAIVTNRLRPGFSVFFHFASSADLLEAAVTVIANPLKKLEERVYWMRDPAALERACYLFIILRSNVV